MYPIPGLEISFDPHTREATVVSPPARFQPGRIVWTPGFAALGISALDSLTRHTSGDWGDVCAEDAAENEYAIERGLRIMSVYKTPSGVLYWVITEADRSATTFLLPSEY